MDPSEVTRYLGDGLYASHDGYQYKLYAHNGREATDVVYLDREVLRAFLQFVEERTRGER